MLYGALGRSNTRLVITRPPGKAKAGVVQCRVTGECPVKPGLGGVEPLPGG
jgi:hypothetical protein